MDTSQINKKLKDIPPHLIPEVLDYIEFLIKKNKSKSKRPSSFNFEWEGALSELSNKFNSVDLQHKILEWR